jgi:hypothetical protein
MRRIALFLAAAFVFLPAQARSEDGGYWSYRFIGYNEYGMPRYAQVYCRSDGRCYRPGRHANARPRHNGTRVYSYVRREAADEGPGCRDIRRAVGDQHLTTDGAKKAANDAWAGAVRFHLGEKYMDLVNARHVVYTCSRSSIKEGGVTTLGQTLTRCEIEAQPCHPPRQTEANEK